MYERDQNTIHFFRTSFGNKIIKILTNVLVDLQVDILGQSLYDLSHPCEHAELKDMLSTKANSSSRQRSHFLRMKCTLTSKGRNVNIKSATYKVN